MNNLLLIIGSHARHSFIASPLTQCFEHVKLLQLRRESVMPICPDYVNSRDRQLFKLHFEKRLAIENSVFGNESDYKFISDDFETTSFETMDQLNAHETERSVRLFKPDICIVFGSGMIKDPLFSALPALTFNVHLGLSPFYKGAATLFWPFYNLEPNHAGVTLHKLKSSPDSGEILHQSVPTLVSGMCLHDVGVASVVKIREDILALVDRIKNGLNIPLVSQKEVGKNFKGKDFRPEHLRLNYELFEDKMVDAFLQKDIRPKQPTLINGLV